MDGKISKEAYEVLHNANTERPFTSKLLKEGRAGTFKCAACDTPLFASSTKFNSGTGWPSFYEKLDGVELEGDNKMDMLMQRQEASRAEGDWGLDLGDLDYGVEAGTAPIPFHVPRACAGLGRLMRRSRRRCTARRAAATSATCSTTATSGRLPQGSATVRPPSPHPSRTNRTRLVPPPVLTGHVLRPSPKNLCRISDSARAVRGVRARGAWLTGARRRYQRAGDRVCSGAEERLGRATPTRGAVVRRNACL
jgi:hypothetical protein